VSVVRFRTVRSIDWPLHPTRGCGDRSAAGTAEAWFVTGRRHPDRGCRRTINTGTLQGLQAPCVPAEQACRTVNVTPRQVGGTPGVASGGLGRWHCSKPWRRYDQAQRPLRPLRSVAPARRWPVVLHAISAVRATEEWSQIKARTIRQAPARSPWFGGQHRTEIAVDRDGFSPGGGAGIE